MTEADKLRARWKIAQPILDELDRKDWDYWMSLPVGVRLQRAIEHADAILRSFPPPEHATDDDDLDVWVRVHQHLHPS